MRAKFPNEETIDDNMSRILEQPLEAIKSRKVWVDGNVCRPVLVWTKSTAFLSKSTGLYAALQHKLSPVLISQLEELGIARKCCILNRWAQVDCLASPASGLSCESCSASESLQAVLPRCVTLQEWAHRISSAPQPASDSSAAQRDDECSAVL